MKTILTALILALVGLLCGCANLGTLLQPESDTQLIAADATAESAQSFVDRFLAYEKANPNSVGMDARMAARGLRERFPGNLTDLQNIRKLYTANRTDANRSRLLMALESIRSDRDVAAAHLDGYALPQRGMGAPFAPPLGSMPPALPAQPQTIVVDQQQVVAELKALRTAVAHIGLMLHTNIAGTLPTNAPPIPGK